MNIILKKWQILISIFLLLTSFSVSILLLIDSNKPSYYNLLFVLPLTFAFYLFMCIKLFRNFFDNIGMTMILGLLFVRLVISPFFKFLDGYIDKITLNVQRNTPMSIVLVAYETITIKLVSCDIAVNPIKAGSAGSIINKVGDYAAAGLPVLNTQESFEYRSLIDKYQVGFNCKNNDEVDLADKLLKLYKDENLRKKMSNNSRRLAREKFDRSETYQEIFRVFCNNDDLNFNV